MRNVPSTTPLRYAAAMDRLVCERIFHGGQNLTVESCNYTLHTFGDVFCAVGRERGTVTGSGRSKQLRICTTHVLHGDGSGHWRRIHHHGSFNDAQAPVE